MDSSGCKAGIALCFRCSVDCRPRTTSSLSGDSYGGRGYFRDLSYVRFTSALMHACMFGIGVQSIWRRRVEFYIRTLKAASQVEQNSVRNVMDMKARYGGFAAAVRDKDLPVWVMNVVPSSGPNTLGLVYDRGFIGSLQNW